jgi:hypothetical protein
MLMSMFSATAPAKAVTRFAASVRAFNPAGFRAMTWSSAKADLRDMLATVTILASSHQATESALRLALRSGSSCRVCCFPSSCGAGEADRSAWVSLLEVGQGRVVGGAGPRNVATNGIAAPPNIKTAR